MTRALAVLLAFLCATYAPAEAATKTIFSVVLTRHGVRSPTKMPPGKGWPSWQPVADGYLTKHGYALMTFAGRYYARNAATSAAPLQCSPGNLYVYADIDQRTIESARALIEGICGDADAIPLNHAIEPGGDALFSGSANGPAARASGLIRIGDPSNVAALQRILTARCNNACTAPSPLLSLDASLTEDLFLEYAECRPFGQLEPNGADFVADLQTAMQLHVQMSNSERYGEPFADRRGGNLFAHIAGLLQTKAGVANGSVDGPNVSPDAMALIVGHDTNIASVAGILGAHWRLSDPYVPDDTPPGGALVFDLLRGDDKSLLVRLRFVYQTFAQLRSNTELPNGTVSVPVYFDGCGGIDCTMPLSEFAAIASRLESGGFVRPQWTGSSSEPVDLPPLADPAWERCDS